MVTVRKDSFMFTLTSYIIFWIIVFLVTAIKWYVLDCHFGVRIYRFCYRLTHEHPLPETEAVGFIFNQTTKRKLFMATLVSTVQSMLMLIYSDVNPLVELFMWGFEVPVTMLGFYLAPYAYRWWTKKDDLFEWFDDVESGRRDPWAWFRQNWRRTKKVVQDAVVPDGGDLKTGDAAAEAESEKQVPESEKKEEAADPRQMVQKYIDSR